MFERFPSIARALHVAGCACLLTCSGCFSSSPEPEDAPKEVAPPKSNDIEQPQDVLFQTAKQSYNNSLYSVAKDQFEALKNNFPSGPYFEIAELKTADCVYELKDYPNAMQLYEEFAKNRPGNPASAYALLRAGNAARAISKGVGRDQAQLEKARELYERLIEQYPDSVYLRAALTGRKELISELGTYENMIAEFYKKKGKTEAYAARQRMYEEKWKPLMAETDAQVAAASVEPKVQIAAVDTNLASPKLLTAVRLSKQEGSGSTVLTQEIVHPVPATNYRIDRAECREGAVFLYLNKFFDEREFIRALGTIKPQNGALRLTLPNTSADAQNVDCHGDGDLHLGADGSIVLDDAAPASVFTLRNPARIVIAPE